MATKAGIFDGVMTELGDRVLTDTGEAVEAGRVLNKHYDQVVKECLSAGSWNFAIETIRALSDTGTVVDFGYTKVFKKPTDWVRTVGVSKNEFFDLPLDHYFDDANFWSSDTGQMFIRYVSDDTGLGLFLSRWPAAFERYVELELASRVAFRLTQSHELREAIKAERDSARNHALSIDTMNEPQPLRQSPGKWTEPYGGSIDPRQDRRPPSSQQQGRDFVSGRNDSLAELQRINQNSSLFK